MTKTKPKVGVNDLADKYPTVVTVDRGGFQLRLYKKLKLQKSYPIAVGPGRPRDPGRALPRAEQGGRPGLERPELAWAGDLAGQGHPGGAPNNPLKARWLGIYNGAGIHGTDDVSSLGSRPRTAASAWRSRT